MTKYSGLKWDAANEVRAAPRQPGRAAALIAALVAGISVGIAVGFVTMSLRFSAYEGCREMFCSLGAIVDGAVAGIAALVITATIVFRNVRARRD